jgi:gamma-glutamylcyclotransferase (GGCT)/AIG2-like uncharacterized protein YtfP
MSHFHLFVYAPPSPGGLQQLPEGREWVGQGLVRGTLYRLDGPGPVLMLYGNTPVAGEIWRCPAASLAQLDADAGTGQGRLRKVARQVALADGGGEALACWLYVAGPALARELLPERRAKAG